MVLRRIRLTRHFIWSSLFLYNAVGRFALHCISLDFYYYFSRFKILNYSMFQLTTCEQASISCSSFSTIGFRGCTQGDYLLIKDSIGNKRYDINFIFLYNNNMLTFKPVNRDLHTFF